MLSSLSINGKKRSVEWKKKTSHLSNQYAITHHNNWEHLLNWLEIDLLAELEPRPGVPPTAGHLNAVLAQVKESPSSFAIIRSTADDPKPSRWLANMTSLPAYALALSPDESERIFQWMDRLINTLAVN